MIEGFSTTSFMDEETRVAYVSETWSPPGALSRHAPTLGTPCATPPYYVPEPGASAAMRGAGPELSKGDFSLAMPASAPLGEADQALRPSTFAGLEEFAPDLTPWRRFAECRPLDPAREAYRGG